MSKCQHFQKNQIRLPFLAQPQVLLRVQLSPLGHEVGSQRIAAAAEQLQHSEHPSVHVIALIYRVQ